MKTILLIPKCSIWLRYFFSVVILMCLATTLFAQEVKEEWVQKYGSTKLINSEFKASVVDNAGNVYVTGNNDSTIVTVKYSPAGTVLWSHFATGTDGAVQAITLDNTGGVYILTIGMHVIKLDRTAGILLWKAQYQGTGEANAIAADERGGVYIAGFKVNEFGSKQYLVVKYNASNGSVVWESEYKGDLRTFAVAHAITVDNSGGVYVTGTSANIRLTFGPSQQPITQYAIVTIKYNASKGEQLWIAKEEDSGFDTDAIGYTIAYDGSNGIYITGIIFNSNRTVKYDATTGERLWSNEIDGEYTEAYAQMTLDDDGNAYVLASTDVIEGGQKVGSIKHLVKYSATNGETLWEKRLEAEPGKTLFIASLAAGTSNDVYVTLIEQTQSGEAAFLTIRYNTTGGAADWFSRYTIPDGSSVGVSAIVTNGKGDLYLTSSISQPASVNQTYLVIKYNTATGNEEWVEQFERLINDDISIDVAVDSEGNSYVTGLSGSVSKYMKIGGPYEIVTIKYSPEGEELWVSSYPLDNSSNSGVNVSKIVVDNAGGVYIIGSSGGDFLTIKYSASNGELLWDSFHDTGSLGDFAADIAVDNAGGVYVTGFNPSSSKVATIKYDSLDGSIIWISNYGRGGSTTAISVMNGFVYVAARSNYMTRPNGTMDSDIVLLKYSAADGIEEWVNFYDSGQSEYPVAMAVDASDEIYILGESGVSFVGSVSVLVKFNAATGNVEWSVNTENGIRAGGLAVDSKEGVFVSGYKEGSTFLIKFDSFGGQAWMKEETTGSIVDPKQSIKLDGVGGIYLARIVSDGIKTSKYDTVDGTLQWEILKEVNINKQIYGPSPQVSLAIDSNQNVIVSGYDINDGSRDLDILTIKYSQQEDDLPCFDPLPVQLSLPPHAVRVGEQVRTTADFGDYVPGEAHNIRWEWGDQGQPTVAYFSAGDSHITGEHTYSQAGIYRVGLDFSESCLVPENYDFEEWLVIYDPNAGSVTGGGQLLSLQTQLPWMSQQQNAQFSFNVRYNQNKDTAPQGQIQLNLHQQGVFRSNAIEWLVVRGDQALWQGTGTLNGEGNYGFTASVWDGRGTGSDDAVDELRIRIWDKNNGNMLVYDNIETAGDIYDMTNPTSRIVRGQIIIHPFATASKTASQQSELYNYPNTFKDKTTINFTPAKAGNYTLEVYDMRGKLVKQLWEGEAEEGQNYSVELDGTSLPKGIYVARLVSSTGSQSIKMLLER